MLVAEPMKVLREVLDRRLTFDKHVTARGSIVRVQLPPPEYQARPSATSDVYCGRT